MHLYKTTEWQDEIGEWHCNDVSDLAGVSSRWWTPARMLGMPLDEYVTMLIKEFRPDKIWYSYTYNVLGFSWDNRDDCRKYKN